MMDKLEGGRDEMRKGRMDGGLRINQMCERMMFSLMYGQWWVGA